LSILIFEESSFEIQEERHKPWNGTGHVVTLRKKYQKQILIAEECAKSAFVDN
jgi:hypothetical protein